jgi:hypothetical protein
MTGNIDGNMPKSAQDQSTRKLAQKEWHRPSLRKLPIAATAGSTGKAAGAQNDGNTNKSGDVSNLS